MCLRALKEALFRRRSVALTSLRYVEHAVDDPLCLTRTFLLVYRFVQQSRRTLPLLFAPRSSLEPPVERSGSSCVVVSRAGELRAASFRRCVVRGEASVYNRCMKKKMRYIVKYSGVIFSILLLLLLYRYVFTDTWRDIAPGPQL